MNTTIPAIVLAAGKGTRMMHPELPKVLVEFRGRPMIEYVIGAIQQSGVCQRPTVVVGYRQDKIRDRLGDRVAYVEQLEQRGTGHAVMSARATLEGQGPDVLVFYGDNPLVRAETITAFVRSHMQSGATITLAVTIADDIEASGASMKYYGRIVRNEHGEVVGVTEYKDATDELRGSHEVNTMMYVFNSQWLWSHIDMMSDANAQREYLITDLIAIAADEGALINTFSIPIHEAYGINSKEELEALEKNY